MAISDTSYGRGDTVYSNGSHAPTQGQVDPTGYIDRSLNKPSNSRSGLASAALDRLNNDQQPSTPTPGVLPLGDIKFLTITPTGQLVPSATDPTAAPPQIMPQMSPQLGSMQPGLSPSNGSPSGPLAQAALSRIMANGGGQQ